ncbi:helix-turn-helix domain-containing protein [Rhodococcus coprophilus]|uniref:AraC family transcriptional regulator n=1 Tax=Rhodococcus coprophilus TaxID=38310 RepID=A0A2X4UHU7_9NOCA|nr:helix-turn-helix domain-containing protein [Rhodococcus coprophilus]MBM7458458.1 AraC-like DNA-binding protein [Rhodococcus coprophilus]SQI32530.1 AraC family transcriptional regulator [Rhodococcus coprophilus]
MYREWVSGIPGVVAWEATRAPSGSGGNTVLPDGCMDLIWHEDGFLVAGPDTRAQFSDLATRRKLTAVRFAPGLGPVFLRVDASELRDQRVSLDQIWAPRRVRDIVAAVEGDPGSGLVDAVRRDLDDARRSPLSGLAGALGSGMTVPEAASVIGWSERTLRRRAHQAFGYGPKTLSRVLRFQRAIARARAGEDPATIAAECGYSDQSHLAREVRALSGSTLGDLVRRSSGP